MKPHEAILIKNKEFIEGVALHGNSPQADNSTALSIITAYNDIDSTVEVLHGCASCNNIFLNSFKIILAYCQSVNWFQPSESKVNETKKKNK